MLKKIYIKNGIIFVSDKNNMELNYNIIKKYEKDNKNNKDVMIESIKKYYKSLGITY